MVQAGNKESRFDGELTFLGRVLAQLPVDLQLGKMVVLGHVFGCLEECLIIGKKQKTHWIPRPAAQLLCVCVLFDLNSFFFQLQLFL